MNDEIVLSVCCAVYNHEAYLRKALEAATLELKQRDLIFQKKESLFAKK